MFGKIMKKIYIAGPDVFENNSIQIGEKLVKLCKNNGYKGLYPLDNVVDFSQSKHKIAEDIFKANIEMIQQADIIIANLNSFRGKEADSGTVWECGYAYGLGKYVYGYMDKTSSYIENFSDDEKTKKDDYFVDDKDRLIEDFNLSINLMIACSVNEIVEGSFEDVLRRIKNN
jgi:nucleoside 2-deoxyribosyltransferase